jgi:hypothetical protein
VLGVRRAFLEGSRVNNTTVTQTVLLPSD